MPGDGQCRCGSGDRYAACCGPLHAGQRPAATAVALMRSRFTAYALGDVDYLLATWHPSTRPAQLRLDEGVTWRRLQIVDSVAGLPDDTTGSVEFRAQYVYGGKRHLMQEHSRFVRSGGRWLYVDGDLRL